MPVIGFNGLGSAQNEIAVADGYLRRADNCVIRQRGVVEPRRGQPYYPATDAVFSESFGFDGHTMKALFSWGSVLVGHHGTSLSKLALGSWTAIPGTYSGADEMLMRMKFTIALQRLYLATSLGLYRALDSSATPTRAGILAPMWTVVGGNFSEPVPLAGGFLAVNKAVAYRALVKRTDANGREIVGEVSSRMVIINPPSATSIIGGMTRASGTVTVTTNAAHSFRVGMQVTLSPGEANFAVGPHEIASVPDSTHFTYLHAGANVSNTVQQTISIGAAQCTLRLRLPADAVEGDVFQLYRSEVSASATTPPGEEMLLAYEATITDTDILAGYLEITDNTPEVMLGQSGYFSPSRDGLENNHQPPMFAKEVATVGDVMVSGNLRDRHRVEVALLATGGSAGFASGDSIVFTRSGYTTITLTPNNVYTGGTVAQDIEATAIEMVQQIHSYVGNTWLRATYISGPDDAPGRMLFEALDFATPAFTVVCTGAPTAFNPTLPSDPATTSKQKLSPGAVQWSLPGEPEAMPAIYQQDIGLSDEALLRIIPLRDKTILVKERSFWCMSGSFPNFRFDKIDDTVRVVGPDTASAFANMVFCLTDCGVAQVSDSGVGILSEPEGDAFLDLLSDSLISNVKLRSWGLGRDAEGQFLLAVPGKSTDTAPTVVWVWNAKSKAWTKWPMTRTCAAVLGDTEELFLGDERPGLTRRENRFFNGSDNADEALYISITGAPDPATPKRVPLANTNVVEVGDYLEDAAGVRSVVTAVNATSVDVATEEDWETGTGYLHKHYPCILEILPNALGAASVAKQGQEVVWNFKEECFYSAEVAASSDGLPAATPTKTISRPGFGYFAWGSGHFGTPVHPRNERALVPAEAQRADYFWVRLTVAEAFAQWRLNGVSLEYAGGSGRVKR